MARKEKGAINKIFIGIIALLIIIIFFLYRKNVQVSSQFTGLVNKYNYLVSLQPQQTCTITLKNQTIFQILVSSPSECDRLVLFAKNMVGLGGLTAPVYAPRLPLPTFINCTPNFANGFNCFGL